MKITQATIFPVSIPLIEPIKMANDVVIDAKTVLLSLRDEQGRIGWGEASIAPMMTGETLDSLCASLGYLLDKMRKFEWSDPRHFSTQFNTVLYGNSSAKSCLEMALLDLYTQRESVPLWKYLRTLNPNANNPELKAIPILRMLGGSLERELEDAKIFRELGFKHWKIKIGSLSVEEDLHRVDVLSEVLAGDVVSVDANGAMSLDAAIHFCSSSKASRLTFAEQLISPDSSLDDFILLKQCSPIPIGLDESIHGSSEIDGYLKADAFNGASLKLIKTGGVLNALSCANTLAANSLHLNLACKVAETSLSAAATAAIGFAVGAVNWGFSMSNQYLRFDICDQPLHANNGHLNREQLDLVGVGVSPNLDRVKEAIAYSYSAIQY